jgi:hypothetical protein
MHVVRARLAWRGFWRRGALRISAVIVGLSSLGLAVEMFSLVPLLGLPVSAALYAAYLLYRCPVCGKHFVGSTQCHSCFTTVGRLPLFRER